MPDGITIRDLIQTKTKSNNVIESKLKFANNY